jgi:hypothetical protein
MRRRRDADGCFLFELYAHVVRELTMICRFLSLSKTASIWAVASIQAGVSFHRKPSTPLETNSTCRSATSG